MSDPDEDASSFGWLEVLLILLLILGLAIKKHRRDREEG